MQYKGCFGSFLQKKHLMVYNSGFFNALVKDNIGVREKPQLHSDKTVEFG